MDTLERGLKQPDLSNYSPKQAPVTVPALGAPAFNPTALRSPIAGQGNSRVIVPASVPNRGLFMPVSAVATGSVASSQAQAQKASRRANITPGAGSTTSNQNVSFGVTQIDQTLNRAASVVYQNTTGTVLLVTATFQTTTGVGSIVAVCDGSPSPTTLVGEQSAGVLGSGVPYGRALTFIVPPSYYYKITPDTTSILDCWIEYELVTTTNGSAVAASLGFTPLNPANNLSDVLSILTSRTNLGLGTAATQNTGAFLQPANNLSDVASLSTSLTNLVGSWNTWTPALSASGSMTISGVAVNNAYYLKIGGLVLFSASVTFSIGGTASNTIMTTLPVAPVGTDFGAFSVFGNIPPGPVQEMLIGFLDYTNHQTLIRLNPLANYSLGGCQVWMTGSYKAS